MSAAEARQRGSTGQGTGRGLPVRLTAPERAAARKAKQAGYRSVEEWLNRHSVRRWLVSDEAALVMAHVNTAAPPMRCIPPTPVQFQLAEWVSTRTYREWKWIRALVILGASMNRRGDRVIYIPGPVVPKRETSPETTDFIRRFRVAHSNDVDALDALIREVAA